MKQEYVYILFSLAALAITIIAFALSAIMYQSDEVYSDISLHDKKMDSLISLQEKETQKITLLEEEILLSQEFYEETKNELQSLMSSFNKTDEVILDLENDLFVVKEENANLKIKLSSLEAKLS